MILLMTIMKMMNVMKLVVDGGDVDGNEDGIYNSDI